MRKRESLQMDQLKALLQLTRLGIGHERKKLDDIPDWRIIERLAGEQGLTAIILDGINQLQLEQRPPKEMLLNWIGSVMQGYEYRYAEYEKAIVELAKFYSENGIKMMVLKGYGLGKNYPAPNHRPCGDIDIWNFGRQEEADALIKEKYKIHIDKRELHHTCFDWKGYLVENHYDFLIVQTIKTNSLLEPILKKLAKDNSWSIDVEGVKIYIPSPNLNALFLLRHMLMHFVAIGISIRHLLDWGFFWKRYGHEVDCDWLLEVLSTYKMDSFFNTINAICVEELGFNSSVFPKVQFNPYIKERVLKDILCPEYDWAEVHRLKLFSRIVFKYKRWKASAWKRELCYKEGEWVTFWSSIRAHLLQPVDI